MYLCLFTLDASVVHLEQHLVKFFCCVCMCISISICIILNCICRHCKNCGAPAINFYFLVYLYFHWYLYLFYIWVHLWCTVFCRIYLISLYFHWYLCLFKISDFHRHPIWQRLVHPCSHFDRSTLSSWKQLITICHEQNINHSDFFTKIFPFCENFQCVNWVFCMQIVKLQSYQDSLFFKSFQLERDIEPEILSNIFYVAEIKVWIECISLLAPKYEFPLKIKNLFKVCIEFV